ESQMRNRLLGEGTEELISQANWTKRCADEATKRYTEERAVTAAIQNHRSLSKSLTEERIKLNDLSGRGLDAELEAQMMIVSQLERKVLRATEAVRLSKEALKVSEDIEKSTRMAAQLSANLVGTFESLLNKVPGGGIFK